MKGIFKNLAASALAAATLITGTLTASADEVVLRAGNYQDTSNNATIKWGVCYCEMINNSTVVRKAQTYVKVYKDLTGVLVDQTSRDGSIGYGESVRAELNGYYSNGYNFEFTGIIYNGNSFSSGVSWGKTTYLE